MLELLCPLCQTPLTTLSPTWHCQRGHTFDVAREGYVNLLPVQHRRSLHPGDDDAALQARRRFLDGGHYEPLRLALQDMVASCQGANWLDVGCGEGYYTATLHAEGRQIYGIDIAKTAVRMAAKRHPNIHWLVASAARLPCAAQTLDAVCSLFAPIAQAELCRVLKSGAYLIHATPAEQHLQQLRAALFAEVHPHQPQRHLQALQKGFHLEHTLCVEAELDLHADALADLITMTPYAWAASAERRAELLARARLRTQMQVQLSLLRRLETDATPRSN